MSRSVRASATEAGYEPRTEGDPGASPSEPPVEVRNPVWPSGRTASISLTGLLCLIFFVPLLAETPPAALAAIAAVPAALSALTARLLFEFLAAARGKPTHRWVGVTALAASVVGGALVTVAALVLGLLPRWPALAAAVAGGIVTLGLASGVRAVELRVRASSRRVLFIGGGSQARDLTREISRRGDLSLVGFLDIQHAAAPPERRDIIDAVLSRGATTLVVTSEAISNPTVVAAASELNLKGVRVRGLNDFYEQQFAKVPLSELSPSWFLFDIAEIHRARFYGAAKRVVETLVAASILLITGPLVPVIVLGIRASGPGPVFFRQERIGKDGQSFTVTKFRTMTPAAVVEAEWGTSHRHRVTRLGAVLRRFRLDELPQLLQVVRGHMSLVGPRPEQPAIVERLEAEIGFYGARHRVRPGLTGWAQVNHGYGGSDDDVLEKLQYDFFYIKRQSLKLDLLILAATFRIVLSGRGY